MIIEVEKLFSHTPYTTKIAATISVRISEKERAALKKHGKISNVVRESLSLYLGAKRSRTVIKRLKELQRNTKVQTIRDIEAALIAEDRRR
ncbi:MAG: hypothetical protein ACREBU_15895 [Nitrososphaera sp.]